MKSRLLWIACLVLALAGCAEIREVPATQTTVQIGIDSELLPLTQMLRVRTAAQEGGGWVPRNDKSFDVEGLKWPVEIVVLPRSEARADEPFDVVVEALAQDGSVLAQTRARSGFALRQQRTLALRLSRCGARPFGFVCEPDPDCFGPACAACIDATCVDTPFTDPLDLPGLNLMPAADAGIDAAPPSDDGGTTDPDADDADASTSDGSSPGSPDAEGPVQCANGTELDDAGSCADIDECARQLDDCDQSPRACMNVGSGLGFACVCPSGYRGDGRGENGCTDIDECMEQTHQCGMLVMCNNTPGNYSCGSCPAGYAPDPNGDCADIDECETNSGGCDTSPMAACNNVVGGPNTCTCPSGYSGDGKGPNGCVDIKDCTATSCMNGGTCVEGVGSFTCMCAPPFTGDRCELEICGTVTIRTRADVATFSRCTEVTGNFNLQPDFADFTASDLPHLRTVRGDFNIGGQMNSIGQRVTFGALTTIGGRFTFVGMPQGFRELRFPALTTIGTPSAPVIVQIFGNLSTLEMPELRNVYGDVGLSNTSLCSANFRRSPRVSGDLNAISDFPHVPYSSLAPLLNGVAGTVAGPPSGTDAIPIGCCTFVDTSNCRDYDLSVCQDFTCR